MNYLVELFTPVSFETVHNSTSIEHCHGKNNSMVPRYTFSGQAAKISFSELCAANNTRLPDEEDLATLKKIFRDAIDQINLDFKSGILVQLKYKLLYNELWNFRTFFIIWFLLKFPLKETEF